MSLCIQYQSRRFYPDLYGGLEVSGLQLVQAWQEMGHRVDVLIENYPDGPYQKDEPLPGLKGTRIRTAGRGGLWRLAAWARVARWACHQRPTCGGAHGVVAAYPECVLASKLALPRRPVLYRLIAVGAI